MDRIARATLALIGGAVLLLFGIANAGTDLALAWIPGAAAVLYGLYNLVVAAVRKGVAEGHAENSGK